MQSHFVSLTRLLVLLTAFVAVGLLLTGCKSKEDEGEGKESAPDLQAEASGFYLDAGEALIAALQGKEYDTEKYGTYLAETINDLTKEEFAKLGDNPEVILVRVKDLEAGQVEDTHGGYMSSAQMYVLPSGELRYDFILFESSGKGKYNESNLGTAGGKGIAYLLSELEGDCNVPLMTEEDAKELPEWIFESTMVSPPVSMDGLQKSVDFHCKKFEGRVQGELGPGADGDAFDVYVKGDRATGAIRTQFWSGDGKRFGLNLSKAGCTNDTRDECERTGASTMATVPVESIISVHDE